MEHTAGKNETSYTAAVITVSDAGARGVRLDTSGPALCSMLEQEGWNVVFTAVVPDERETIAQVLKSCAEEKKISLVLTTGGTGFSMRDVTPEATMDVIQRMTPGIPEAMRAESMKITPKGCLSRGTAGIRNETWIINFPGSEKSVRETFPVIAGALHHGVDMIRSCGSANCGR